MSGLPAATSESSTWQALLGLESRQAGERAIVCALLERLRERAGWAGAVLELEGEALPAARAAVGASSVEGTEGWLSVPLPGAVLSYLPAEPGGPLPAGTELLALASAANAWRLKQTLERQRFAINYRGVELEALYDVGLAIASTLDFEQLCEEILLRAVSLLDARRGALYLRSGDSYELGKTLGGSARDSVHLEADEVRQLLAGLQEAGGLLPGARYELTVPIEVEGQRRGLLVVADKESRHGVGPFPASDSRTLDLFANQAAIALENARLHRDALEKERLERDMQLAADIQRRLLPTVYPEIPGFELVGWSRPARHVGGDYYNLLARPGGKLAAVVADVSGKGMPAALMVSTAHSALNLLLDGSEIGPGLVERLNRHVMEASAPNKFITLLLAEVDPGDGAVSYVNAGHNPGLLMRAGGEVEELAAGGLPLGMFGGSYRAGRAQLSSGDMLCLFSDGITEAADPAGQEFGPERLAELLRQNGGKTLSSLVGEIDSATLEFAQGCDQADDQTLVLLRRA